MKKIYLLAKKEWQNYVFNPLGYIFAGLLLLVSNWLFMSDLFLLGQADLRPLWSTMNFLFSLFVPAISMGLLADEKKNGTWEVLLSLPITETELVLGKFMGSCMYLVAVVGLSLPMMITMMALGQPDIGIMVAGFLGTCLLGMAYLAVGIFMSAVSGQAVVAFLTTTVFLIVNNLLGQGMVLSRLPDWTGKILSNISLAARSSKFSAGLVEINDLFFFISWITVFMILTVLSLKARDK